MVQHFLKYAQLFKKFNNHHHKLKQESIILHFASDVDADPLSILHTAVCYWNGPLADKYFSWFERLYRMHTSQQFSGSTDT